MFWWRLNGIGELTATISSWIIAPLMLFAHVFDKPVQALCGTKAAFSTDPNLLGARMLFMVGWVLLVGIGVSYCTQMTDENKLKNFVKRARPFHFFWKPIIQHLGENEYKEAEGLGRTLISLLLALGCAFALTFGVGKLLLGSKLLGILYLCGFGVFLSLQYDGSILIFAKNI